MNTESTADKKIFRRGAANKAAEHSSKKQRNPRRRPMDVGCITEQTRPLSDNLRRRVIGQENAVEAVTCSFSRVLAGLRDPTRPALSLLLTGPTGVGKTETARALAETLFGWEQALTRVNCEEFSHSHELAKLLGAPPGYIGHQVEPLLSQRRIDEPHRRARLERSGMVSEPDGALYRRFPPDQKKQLSIILFDEIEKAHPALWNAMLGILEGGTLTLGDNRTTDFTGSIVVMTSNVGSHEMSEALSRRRVGFHSEEEHHQRQSKEVRQVALSAARKEFPLEFLNRFDEILVFSPLENEHLKSIFDKFLSEIHTRAINQAGVPLLIKVSPEARNHILERGTDLVFGARPLRRAMEVELVDPLSRLIASQKLSPGDVVEVEREGERLEFYRNEDTRTALIA